jgi:hypothetical protein
MYSFRWFTVQSKVTRNVGEKNIKMVSSQISCTVLFVISLRGGGGVFVVAATEGVKEGANVGGSYRALFSAHDIKKYISTNTRCYQKRSVRIFFFFLKNRRYFFSVPDPPDPHIFGPSGSGPISQRYGSGSFYQQAKIVKKP